MGEQGCMKADGREKSHEKRKNRLLFYIDAFLINASFILTTGVFLSGFVIYLKGSDFLVAFLNNSVIWTSIISLCTIFIMKKIVHMKRFLIILNLASRCLVCGIVLLPLMFSNQTAVLYAVSIAVILSNILWSIYSVGWTSWFVGSLSDSDRNSNLYKRIMIVRISITVATLGMGIVLDSYNKSFTGFFLVFLVGFVLSIVDAVTLLFVSDLPEEASDTGKVDLNTLMEPLVNRSYRKYLLFTLLFYVSITISSSFTSIYLIKYMGFNYTYISVIQSITYILMIVCNQFWSEVEKRRGTEFVLMVSGLIATGEFLIYFFLNENTYYLLYLAAILSGIGNSGFNASLFNYRFEIVGEKSKVLYESWFKTIYGISVLLAPFIGETFLRLMASSKWSITQAGGIRQLYFISFAVSVVVVVFSFAKKPESSSLTK